MNRPNGGAPDPGLARPLQSTLAPAAALLVAGLTLLAYRSVGQEYYRDYAFPQGGGMGFLLPEEIAFLAMYVAFGALAAGALTYALARTELGSRFVELVRALARHDAALAAAVGVAVALASWAIGTFVLGHAVTTDDEHVYQFIAQTLRTGHLTAPSPGTDLAFYREQFVVLTPTVRFGKYPIGFPLFLAAGQALGLEAAVVPLLTGLIAGLIFAIGRRAFGPAVTTLALLLFATSPQVLTTGASFLSQPASALCLMAGTAALLAARASPTPLRWLALAGLAFGYGMLARPLPGALFAAVAGLDALLQRRTFRWSGVAALALPMALGAAGLLLENRLQAGAALTSGYQAFHKTGGGLSGVAGLLGGGVAERSMSVFANLFRLNVWLFGWPLSLLALPFAARRGAAALMWMMVAAELAYRLLSAKAGAGGTGPAYFFEAVPLLCLLSAEGLVRLARDGLGPLKLDARWVGSAAVASTVVGAALFLPARLDDLSRMATAEHTLPSMLGQRGIHHALVFHEGIVPVWLLASWAYYPPCNSPALDDDILYVLYQRSGDPGANLEFWRRRYPDRSAWYFGWPPDSEPQLDDLASYVRSQKSAQP